MGFSLILQTSQYPAPDCLWQYLHLKFVPYSFPQSAKVSPKRPMVHPRAIQRLPRSLLQPPRHIQELLKKIEELHKSHHGIPRWSCTLYWSPKSSSRGPHDSALSFSAGLFSVQSRQYSQPFQSSSPAILQPSNLLQILYVLDVPEPPKLSENANPPVLQSSYPPILQEGTAECA